MPVFAEYHLLLPSIPLGLVRFAECPLFGSQRETEPVIIKFVRQCMPLCVQESVSFDGFQAGSNTPTVDSRTQGTHANTEAREILRRVKTCVFSAPFFYSQVHDVLAIVTDSYALHDP